jgi:hypothetical protein
LERKSNLVKKILVLLILLIAGLGWYLFYPREQASTLKAQPTVADSKSFTRKLSELAAAEKDGSSRKVEFRESEVDAYIQHELAPLFPNGLKRVDVQLLQGSVAANSLINFDEIESSSGGERNLLFSTLFRGEHTLDVVATLKTENHTGRYEIAKVSLDQQEIPKPLVDLLVQKYVVPKYPAAKPNTPFALPYNIEKVDLLPGKAIVHQGGK